MVSYITQSGIDRMDRIQVKSEHPIVKTRQDMVAIGLLCIGLLVLFVRYNRKQQRQSQ